MKKLKEYGYPAYIIWSAISLMLVLVYIVVNFCFEKPLTSGYEYFDSIKIEGDNLEPSDEIPIIELNIARSDTNPELNLSEMVITEYTDYEQNSYKRYAMQVLGNFEWYCPKDKTVWVGEKSGRASSALCTVDANNFITSYYEIDVDGDVFVHTFDYVNAELDNLDVTAGGENFQLELGGDNGKYTYTREYYSTTGWNAWNKWFNNRAKSSTSGEYNVIDLFGYLIKGFETKESNKVISFDNKNLDEFFTITKDRSGQFYSLSDVTTNNAYFRIKCTYTDITSHLNAKDHSIIGAIAEDVNYSSGVVNMVTPYYSTGVELTLTGNEFIPTRYQGIDGAILAMTPEFKSYLLSLNNLTLNIRIDLDSLLCDEEIVGIDLSSLSNLKIQNLKVDSDTAQNFYIIGASRYIESATYSSNLTLLNSTGGAYEQGN